MTQRILLSRIAGIRHAMAGFGADIYWHRNAAGRCRNCHSGSKRDARQRGRAASAIRFGSTSGAALSALVLVSTARQFRPFSGQRCSRLATNCFRVSAIRCSWRLCSNRGYPTRGGPGYCGGYLARLYLRPYCQHLDAGEYFGARVFRGLCAGDPVCHSPDLVP